MPPLTDAQQAEIDRRLADFADHPELGVAWEDLRARLWSRLG
jgi:putative addiction module component (TIGR02574 family)